MKPWRQASLHPTPNTLWLGTAKKMVPSHPELKAFGLRCWGPAGLISATSQITRVVILQIELRA